ncbi:ABC transporter [Calderihabitans maritimus]|uniref:ABC transporter n=1 Tax=Calderihabitans maritimus TaxID=1246530 RepID=A0A1Z5HRC7_9FIRM|nr:ABC transporter [Calderihabitans maritimus]
MRQFGTVVVEAGGNIRLIEPYNLWDYGPEGPEFRGEEAFTRAIIALTHKNNQVIYFLQGHGELDPDREGIQLRRFLEGEGYSVKSLNLATQGDIPADAALIVMAGLRKDLNIPERERLEKFMDNGGKLMILVDPLPEDETLTETKKLLDRLGVQIERDVVVDPARAYFMDALSPVPLLNSHPITEKLMEKRMLLVLPRARSLKVDEQEKGLKITPLLTSSGQSWGETDWTSERLRKEPADISGPLTLAVAVSREDAKDGAEPSQGEVKEQDKTAASPQDTGEGSEEKVAVVVGNSSFVAGDNVSFQGNLDFFVNAVDWLLGEETLISIRPKPERMPHIFLTPAQAKSIFYGTVVGMPALVLLIGGAVWLRRRSL